MTLPAERIGRGWYRRRCELQSRKNEPAEKWPCCSKAPGWSGSRWWSGVSLGRTSGSGTPRGSSSWFRGLWWPPKSIQPVQMGQNRNTCMPPLFQSRDIRTHPEQLLGEGRYRWRHDQVLKSIAEAISKGIKDSRHTQAKAKAIPFIRVGQKPEKASKNCSVGLLSTARDWAMTVDLER